MVKTRCEDVAAWILKPSTAGLPSSLAQPSTLVAGLRVHNVDTPRLCLRTDGSSLERRVLQE